MSAPLLKVENLRVTYRAGGRNVAAVKGVSFEVARGRCLGVVGESGSGKSSLARAILALEDDVAGRVEFDGQDVLKLDRAGRLAFRRRAQMVFQDPLGSLNPRLKAGAALAEVLRVHGLAQSGADAAAQAARWLETVGLDAAYANRFPHELSGGQRQRVNLARALCVGAEFLVADEPVSALDVTTRIEVIELLARLRRERQLSIVMVSHDMSVVAALCDTTVVLKDGEVIEAGATMSILNDPHEAYTRQLINAIPRLPAAPASGR